MELRLTLLDILKEVSEQQSNRWNIIVDRKGSTLSISTFGLR